MEKRSDNYNNAFVEGNEVSFKVSYVSQICNARRHPQATGGTARQAGR